MALAPTLELAARIVRPGGIAFLWKGSRLDGEIAASPSMGKDWEIVERRKLSNDMTEVLKLLRKA